MILNKIKSIFPAAVAVLAMGFMTVSCTGDLDVENINPKQTSTLDADALLNKIYSSFVLTGQEGPHGNQDIADLDAYIKGLGDMVRSGAISENRINESVTRILRTKEKYGLLDKVQKASPKNAANIVGSKEHKAVEWEITQKAVTATKNDGVFPIGKDKRVVIFYPKKEELNSIKAGVKKAGINKVDYIFDGEGVSSSADSSIQNADVVICISSCATGGELKNTATVDTLIEKTKNNGKKTMVLSTNLPYDLQKFNNADALVACYGPGVNITAAIYKIFLG